MKLQSRSVEMTYACSSGRSLWLDVSRLIRRQAQGIVPTGIDRVCLAYLEHHREHARAVVRMGPFTAWLDVTASLELFEDLLKHARDGCQHTWWGRAKVLQSLWWSLRSIRPQAGDVLLHVSHSDLDDDEYITSWARMGVRPVVMVHDLIPLTHPQFCVQGESSRHGQRMRNALRHAQGIVCNSHDTLRQLRAFADAETIPMPPSKVTHLGLNTMGPTLPRTCPLTHWGHAGTRPYFLMLGTIEPRKNHLMVLQLWLSLVNQLGVDKAPLLVIVGRRGWACDEAWDLLDHHQVLRQVVIEHGHCDDASLLAWMQHARALLFPSHCEGYGLPLLEALQQGLPVIANELSVFSELAGDVPDYVSVQDHALWLQKIKAYMPTDSPERRAQCERMQAMTLPQWASHFQDVHGFVNSLIDAQKASDMNPGVIA
jgi:glycosyltransferase involved in cell wall biosynthesis